MRLKKCEGSGEVVAGEEVSLTRSNLHTVTLPGD